MTKSTSPSIPTVAMKLACVKEKWQNALPMDLLPQEEEGNFVGLGHLPMLESVGSRHANFPEHEKISKELAMFLRATNPTNNVNPGRLQGMLQSGSFSSSVTSTIGYEWPHYVMSQDKEHITRESQRNSGLYTFVIIVDV